MSRNGNNVNNNNAHNQASAQVAQQVEFFLQAFPDCTDIDGVRNLVIAHTDARGNTDIEAVMAGMETLSAPKIDAPKSRATERAAAVAAAATSGPLRMRLRPVMDGGCVGELDVTPEYLQAHSASVAAAAAATAAAAAPSKPARGGSPAKGSAAATAPATANKVGGSTVGLVVILDRSGSMSTNVQRFLRRLLPPICDRLNVPQDGQVAVCAFDHTCQVWRLTRAEMLASRLDAGGRTFMAPAVRAAGHFMMSQQANYSSFRLLVISDGALHDQAETCAASAELSQALANAGVRVKSAAIRFFTSNDQPDTRGLASVLALSTVTAAGEDGGGVGLVDLSSSMEDATVVSACADMFEGDGLDTAVEIAADGDILLSTPWETRGRRSMTLHPGKNFIWFSRRPEELFLTSALAGANSKAPIEFEVADRVSLADVSGSLKPLMDSYLNRMKVLKVVNTAHAVEEIKQILAYFERFDTFIATNEVSVQDLLKDHALRARVEYMRQMQAKRRASLFGAMQQIANDDKVAQLSAAQQADYLRKVEGTNKNAKALARRALGSDSGLDFAGVLRQEIRVMREHYAEIDGIDDSQHASSFYSLETTKAGIKTLVSLTDDEIDEMAATDFIQLLNLVGVPFNSPISNAVDPMLFRVKEIFPGSFISLSDVLIHHLQSGGKPLHAPGFPAATSPEISGVIPYFDDQRIHRFLHRYAPKMLEFTASVCIRRILADIPMTQAFLFAAAVWKMIEVLDRAPSEGSVRLFISFCHDLHTAMRHDGAGAGPAQEYGPGAAAAAAAAGGKERGHFDHVLESLHVQLQQEKAAAEGGAADATGNSNKKGGAAKKPLANRSFFISNVGITISLDPLLQLMNPDTEGLGPANPQRHAIRDAELLRTTMQRVLRALHAFEAYQVVRRVIKHEEDPEPFIRKQLHALLNINLNERSTPLAALFEPEPKPDALVHHCGSGKSDGIEPNLAEYRALADKMWWVDYIAQIPTALACVGKADPVAYFKECWRPAAKDAVVQCELLGLEVTLEGGDDLAAAAAKAYERFKFAVVVQSYLFPTKQARVDEANHCMLFTDLATAEAQRAMMEGYVAGQYAAQYTRDLTNKKKMEKRQIVEELVRRLVDAPEMAEFLRLLRDGLQRGEEKVVIGDTAHVGYPVLRERLMSLGAGVPHRLAKLAVLVTGHDADLHQPVFNGGNVMMKGLEEVEAVFEALGEHTALEELRRRWKDYVKHNYRDTAVPNRHTHHAGKMSYFALGFKSLAEFRAAVDDKTWNEYEREHALCCGVGILKGLYTRLTERTKLQEAADAERAKRDAEGRNDGDDN
jgi:hypothetical protein